jgi:hypothetical protein
MTATRRLAAITAIDVVGYSLLIGEEEAGRSADRREIIARGQPPGVFALSRR